MTALEVAIFVGIVLAMGLLTAWYLLLTDTESGHDCAEHERGVS